MKHHVFNRGRKDIEWKTSDTCIVGSTRPGSLDTKHLLCGVADSLMPLGKFLHADGYAEHGEKLASWQTNFGCDLLPSKY